MIKIDAGLKKLLDDAYPWSTWNEQLAFIWWDIFVPSKRDKLIEGLRMGKNWMRSYEEAKNLKLK